RAALVVWSAAGAGGHQSTAEPHGAPRLTARHSGGGGAGHAALGPVGSLPAPRETDEAAASPLLSGLSRPRYAALGLAASHCGRPPLRAGRAPAPPARSGHRRRRAEGVAGKKWLCISYPSGGSSPSLKPSPGRPRYAGHPERISRFPFPAIYGT